MAAVQRASVCFFWRAHCRMSQRGLGNGLCWPCQPCAAQPPWHAPPPPPHLSYPRPRLHTTPPAQLAALGRARDGRSPGRPPLNRSPPPRRGVCCYVRCMRGPGRHNRLLGAPHSCGTLGVATITWLWPDYTRRMQRHAHHRFTHPPPVVSERIVSLAISQVPAACAPCLPSTDTTLQAVAARWFTRSSVTFVAGLRLRQGAVLLESSLKPWLARRPGQGRVADDGVTHSRRRANLGTCARARWRPWQVRGKMCALAAVLGPMLCLPLHSVVQ